MKRLPQGEDWKDHATPCPNCKEPVLDYYEHFQSATITDPSYWTCDRVEDVEDTAECHKDCDDPHCPYTH